MVTCLVIGDIHYKANNITETDLFSEYLFRFLEGKKYDFIVVLGDTLHQHERIYMSPLCRAIRFLQLLSSKYLVYLLIGNHDRKNNSVFLTDEHPFLGLSYDKLIVVDTTITRNIAGYNFAFVPYVYPGHFKSALLYGNVDLTTTKAIFAHQEFKGAKMGAVTSNIGDEWSLDNPLVISGHIHDFDILQPNVIYTGTPFQHGFGDKDDKTISEVTFTETSFLHKRIDLKLPKKITINITAKDIYKVKIIPHASMRIVISGNNADLKALEKHPLIVGWKFLGIKIVYRDTTQISHNISLSSVLYGTLLYENIKHDDTLRSVYEELFGKPIIQRKIVIKV